MNQFDPFVLVQDFITKFDASKSPEMWAGLVREETKELFEAINDAGTTSAVGYYGQVLKEAADLVYVLTGWTLIIEKAIAAGADAEEVCSTLTEHEFAYTQSLLDLVTGIVGPDALRGAIEVVHASNLTKLDDTGEPIRREDGKVLKGPNYKAPDMAPLASVVVMRLNGVAA